MIILCGTSLNRKDGNETAFPGHWNRSTTTWAPTCASAGPDLADEPVVISALRRAAQPAGVTQIRGPGLNCAEPDVQQDILSHGHAFSRPVQQPSGQSRRSSRRSRTRSLPRMPQKRQPPGDHAALTARTVSAALRVSLPRPSPIARTRSADTASAVARPRLQAQQKNRLVPVQPTRPPALIRARSPPARPAKAAGGSRPATSGAQ